MNRNIAFIAVIFLIAASIFFFTAKETLRAQDNIPDSTIAKKLDEILKNQKTILQNLDSLKGELNIIKIRVTQQQ